MYGVPGMPAQMPPATQMVANPVEAVVAAEGAEPASPPAHLVPDSFVVDETARYSGTVSFYSKLRGYGFIEVAQKGIVPEDKLFVQWKSIQSEDRFPLLVKDCEVEFGLAKAKDWAHRGMVSIRAKAVTAKGGVSISVQDEADAGTKTFIGGQAMRYTGNLKFYNPAYGYGYVTVDPSFVVEGGAVPAQLRVERSEINAGGKQPQWMQNCAVEFGIWTTTRGHNKAYNMTLPGGAHLTQDALENREVVGGQKYSGEVQVWNFRSGWGFIKADESTPLPPHVQAKLKEQTEAASARATARGKTGSNEELVYVRRSDLAPGVRLDKGNRVTFEVYLDDKGVGAFGVQVQTP